MKYTDVTSGIGRILERCSAEGIDMKETMKRCADFCYAAQNQTTIRCLNESRLIHLASSPRKRLLTMLVRRVGK